jgi:hypothetical protein
MLVCTCRNSPMADLVAEIENSGDVPRLVEIVDRSGSFRALASSLHLHSVRGCDVCVL